MGWGSRTSSTSAIHCGVGLGLAGMIVIASIASLWLRCQPHGGPSRIFYATNRRMGEYRTMNNGNNRSLISLEKVEKSTKPKPSAARLKGVDLEIDGASSSPSSARGQRQEHADQHDHRIDRPTSARSSWPAAPDETQREPGRQVGGKNSGGVPVLPTAAHADRHRERDYADALRRHLQGQRASAPWSCWSWSTCPSRQQVSQPDLRRPQQRAAIARALAHDPR